MDENQYKRLDGRISKLDHKLDHILALVKKSIKEEHIIEKEESKLLKRQRQLEREESDLLKKIEEDAQVEDWQNDIMLHCRLKFLESSQIMCEKTKEHCVFEICPKRK